MSDGVDLVAPREFPCADLFLKKSTCVCGSPTGVLEIRLGFHEGRRERFVIERADEETQKAVAQLLEMLGVKVAGFIDR